MALEGNGWMQRRICLALAEPILGGDPLGDEFGDGLDTDSDDPCMQAVGIKVI